MSDLRKGVYILPNLFTTASLLSGFYSIVNSFQVAVDHSGSLERSAVAIIIAAIFDGLDGRVARKTNTATRFGVEYDSLCDLVSFGVAPAVMMYTWVLRDFNRAGWLVAFLYLTCGALRLARFNVQVSKVEKNYFQGLPIPMAALMLSCSALILASKPLDEISFLFAGDVKLSQLFLTFVLAGLMVSTIPYRSFKTVNIGTRYRFQYLVAVVIALVVWAYQPWETLFGIGFLFILSGPFEKYFLPKPVLVYRRVVHRRRVRKSLDRLDQMSVTGDDPENVHPIRKS